MIVKKRSKQSIKFNKINKQKQIINIDDINNLVLKEIESEIWKLFI